MLPVALGEFEGAPRFRGACPHCNQRSGKSERQLLQCAPESIFRDFVTPTSKRMKRRGRSRLQAVDGIPTVKDVVEVNGFRCLAQPMVGDPTTVTSIDTLTVVDNRDREAYVRLFPSTTEEQVKRELAKQGVDPAGIDKVFFSVSDLERWEPLVRALLPGANLIELPAFESGTHRIDGCKICTTTTAYRQAIAKIAFHYYLTTTCRALTGEEGCFRALREFIVNGGDCTPFFRKPAFEFGLPVGLRPQGEAWLSMNWCHVMAARDEDGLAVAYVHLFIGPQNLGQGHYVTLGAPSAKLLLPEPVWAHVDNYGPSSNPNRYAGRVLDASVTRLR